MNDKNRKRLDNAYERAHVEASGALDAIHQLLHDLPAPGNHESPIDWGYVGTVHEVARKLDEIIEFLKSAAA